MKKVLILSCNNAGSGHLMASRAIEEVLKGKVRIKTVDFYNETSQIVDSIMSSYGFVTKNMNWAYGLLYMLHEIPDVDRLGNHLFYILAKKKAIQILEREKPDLIINVHPYSGRCMLKLLANQNLNIPVWDVVTDPITFHRSWIDKRYELILVATPFAKRKASKYINSTKVKIIGTIIHPKFYKKDIPKAVIRQRYNFSNTKHIVLFLGGGEGIGYNEKIIKRLIKRKLDIEIIAACGKNKGALKKLKKYPIKVFGFTERIHEFMRIADVIVGKAGPATISESLICNVPLVLTGYIFGQEKGNVKYVTKNKLGIFSRDSAKIVKSIEGIIKGKIKFNVGFKYRLDKNAVFKLRNMVIKKLKLSN
jgi:1,2-diacylglycerol 3-beta-galactosyltransferase